jgi:hypothetical protein
MTTQHNLFGAPNVYGGFDPPLARSTDPVTSLRAAARQQASGKVGSGAVIILSVLRRVGQPLTYREIWSACTDAERAKLVEPSTICKRLKPMERSGLVRPGPERACTAGGAPSREWASIAT